MLRLPSMRGPCDDVCDHHASACMHSAHRLAQLGRLDLAGGGARREHRGRQASAHRLDALDPAVRSQGPQRVPPAKAREDRADVGQLARRQPIEPDAHCEAFSGDVPRRVGRVRLAARDEVGEREPAVERRRKVDESRRWPAGIGRSMIAVGASSISSGVMADFLGARLVRSQFAVRRTSPFWGQQLLHQLDRCRCCRCGRRTR